MQPFCTLPTSAQLHTPYQGWHARQAFIVCAWLQVSLFSENSSRWLVADQAIMLCGAADAVRGASSPPDELAYIMRQSDSSGEHHSASSA